MVRIILHIDMDAFFPSIEARENPQFQGKPIIVGADPKNGKGRGVVSSASYEARKYGIHSAMPISRAYQCCPTAIFLPVDMELYEKCSRSIMEIVKKYSQEWEVVSLDEAYLDFSFLTDHKEAEILAHKLKKEIFEKEKLTSTVGIGPNKLVAKIASGKAKPDGLLVIQPGQVRNFLEPLAVEDLPGIGPKTAEKLRAIKINSHAKFGEEVNKVKELKKISKLKLKEIFGVAGEAIYEKARGIDKKPVTSEQVAKSVGREHTFEVDTRDPEIIFQTFENIIGSVWQELVENKFISLVKTITVVCRFSGFETHTKSKALYALTSRGPCGYIALKESTSDFKIFKSEAKKLLLKFLLENKKPVRLIGLRIKLFRTGP